MKYLLSDPRLVKSVRDQAWKLGRASSKGQNWAFLDATRAYAERVMRAYQAGESTPAPTASQRAKGVTDEIAIQIDEIARREISEHKQKIKQELEVTSVS